jgi:hypothetical protein
VRSHGRSTGLAPTVAELANNVGLHRDLATDTYGRVYVRDGKLWASMDACDGPADTAAGQESGHIDV